MGEWIFRRPSPAETQREAVQGEFFANESIESEAQMLVREGIQNSLDAAKSAGAGRKGKVTVKITVSGDRDALEWEDVAPFFGDAWPHFSSPGSGLRDCPEQGSRCPFLVFEDFGTRGLCGNTDAYTRPVDGEDNPFYYFLRAEGQSSKSGNDRGRWGIGKFVFPKASRIRSFIALSHREDDNQTVAAMKCILKWHEVGGNYFCPDGWFGIRGDDDLGLPMEGGPEINQLKQLFGLTREGETGLSLVVPWVHPGMDEVAFIKSVIRDFYYPILRGSLDVVVSGPNGSTEISELTFDDVLDWLDGEDQLDADVKGTIMLAKDAAGKRGLAGFHLVQRSDRRPQWAEEMLPEDRKASINRELKNSKIVSVRVPVWVRKLDEEEILSDIKIWLQRDKTATGGRPVFIRDGLVIPGVRASLARGYRSLVLVEDRPMANLLGDAENPSHTQWDAKSENFDGKYVTGAESITFVRTSVKKLVDLLSDEDEEPDILTLADLFPDPDFEPEGEDPEPTPADVEPGTPPPDVPPLPPGKTTTRRISGGFAVIGKPDGIHGNHGLTVSCGYDRAKGSPIKRWKPEDFQLESPPISVVISGGDVVAGTTELNGNVLKVQISGGDFRINVTGFDEHRDLFVSKVGLQEMGDGSL